MNPTPLPEAKAPSIEIYPRSSAAAQAAAQAAGRCVRHAISARGRARITIGTGNSQVEMIHHFTREPNVDWSKVEAFHLDEYLGLPSDHPASFRFWIKTRFADLVHPRVMHYLAGDTSDLESSLHAYAAALISAPIDLTFVGIGENGHIAFNDPPVADFNDPLAIKKVELDEACRRQQVGEGHFPNLAAVPREALTVTCSALRRSREWICCVPDARKARAVHEALEGPVTPACPASLIQTHPAASLYLDPASASLLSPAFVEAKCRRRN